MKTLLTTLILIATPLFAHAQTPAPTATPAVPVCNEEMTNLPCTYSDAEAKEEVTDMLFENHKGFAHVLTQAKGIKTHQTNGFMIEDQRVIFMKRELHPEIAPHVEISTVKYEILLLDCRGTDACMGMSLWTVMAVTESDGYTWDTKYTNKLEDTKLETLHK